MNVALHVTLLYDVSLPCCEDVVKEDWVEVTVLVLSDFMVGLGGGRFLFTGLEAIGLFGSTLRDKSNELQIIYCKTRYS